VAFVKKEVLSMIEMGNYELTSGNKTKYYISVKNFIKSKDNLDKVVEGILSIYNIKEDITIGVIATGAIPIGKGLRKRTGCHLIIINKDATITGNLEENQQVILIDDVFTTGKSYIKAYYTIRAHGGNIGEGLVIATRDLNKMIETGNCLNVNIEHLIDVRFREF
jgi:orotate phosphoribosyltransferase